MIAVAELEQNERKIIKLFYNFEEVPGIDRDDELLSLARYKVIKKTFICKNLLKVWVFLSFTTYKFTYWSVIILNVNEYDFYRV